MVTAAEKELRQREDITEILRYVIYSDYVALDESLKEFPLSIIIVAPVGQGKTSITDQYKDNTGIREVSKVTEYALLHEFMDDLKRGMRLYYPDFVNTGNMKEETVASIISFLKDYINWDGVKTISYFNTHIPLQHPLKGSLMATMASRDFLRMSKGMASSGFLSRIFLVGYHYRREKIIEIMTNYAYGRGAWDTIKLPLPEIGTKIEITMDSGLIKELIPLAYKLGQKIEGYHIRALQQMTLMSKARALSENRTEVSQGDTERVLQLYSDYAVKVPGLDKEVTQIMREAMKAAQAEATGEVSEVVPKAIKAEAEKIISGLRSSEMTEGSSNNADQR